MPKKEANIRVLRINKNKTKFLTSISRKKNRDLIRIGTHNFDKLEHFKYLKDVNYTSNDNVPR